MMKILKSLSLVVAVAAVAGGATYAYFYDAETSTGNKVTAGTLDLEMGGSNSLPFAIGNAYPGMPTETKLISVKNVGSINGHLRFDGSSFVSDENGLTEPESIGDSTDGNTAGELCANLNVKVSIQNTDGSNSTQLYDGPLATMNPTGNALLPANTERNLKVEFGVLKTVGNDIQSDICNINFGLKLVQDIDQDGYADEDDHFPSDPSQH